MQKTQGTSSHKLPSALASGSDAWSEAGDGIAWIRLQEQVDLVVGDRRDTYTGNDRNVLVLERNKPVVRDGGCPPRDTVQDHRKKRPPLDEASGARKKLNPNPNPPPPDETDQTQIMYHSFVQEKENPLRACVQKMVRDAPSLQHDVDQGVAANDAGFTLLAELRKLNERVAKLETECSGLKSEVSGLKSEVSGLKSEVSGLKSEVSDLQLHSNSYLDVRQRAISTWVRDALGKDTPARRAAIRNPNKNVVHAGDVRVDALVVTGRYKLGSTEQSQFPTLYGLSADEVKNLDQERCYRSLQALDRVASILLDKALTSLPDEAMGKQRECLVALLREGRYEEAEEMGPTICGDE